LAALARDAGKVLTHAHLLPTVWGPAHLDGMGYLRVTIRSIRRKVGEEPQTSVIRNGRLSAIALGRPPEKAE